MSKFILQSTRELVDPVEYTLAVMKEHAGNVKIYIGTDSQNLRRKTCYVTAICYHITSDEGVGKGVHVIYIEEMVNKIKDHFTRLWGEAEKSLKYAQLLASKGILIERIDLDYNDDEYWYSNKLVAGGRGMLLGLGYNVATKPEELIATRAADHIIRK